MSHRPDRSSRADFYDLLGAKSFESRVAENQPEDIKTLEEPPVDCLLVLTSSVPERLLPTIRSRCQRVVFAPPAPEWMVPRLAILHSADNSADVRAAAFLSHGSMLAAERYLAGVLREVLESALEILLAAAQGDALLLLQHAHTTARRYGGQRHLYPLLLQIVASIARDALLTAFIANSAFIVLPVLVERCKELLASHQLLDRRTDSATEVLIPIMFNLPNAGKLLTLLFVPLRRSTVRPPHHPAHVHDRLHTDRAVPSAATLGLPPSRHQMQVASPRRLTPQPRPNQASTVSVECWE